MKKALVLILAVLVVLPVLAGCGATVPTSREAKEKLEALGYTVTVELLDESVLGGYDKKQVAVLNAEKDGEFALQAYYFQTRGDTDRFMEEHAGLLRKNVEAFHKFGYSICRGTEEAVEALLK